MGRAEVDFRLGVRFLVIGGCVHYQGTLNHIEINEIFDNRTAIELAKAPEARAVTERAVRPSLGIDPDDL